MRATYVSHGAFHRHLRDPFRLSPIIPTLFGPRHQRKTYLVPSRTVELGSSRYTHTRLGSLSTSASKSSTEPTGKPRSDDAVPLPTMYTTAFAFFEALWEFGVSAVFVNLGSDHPSIIEAMLKGQRERPGRFPRIYTCPHEMVALSMADGWARVTGRPQAVIVHVDVGTQGLGAGVHNASVGRAPVLVFAGLCPYTDDGVLKGSRTEYQHWIQDALDQKGVVRQYCRYVGELRTGRTVKQTVARALQFATSDPKGPVYVVAAREVLAEEIEPYALESEKWVGVGPAALPGEAVEIIVDALAQAKRPLVITGYSGRDHRCPGQLVELAEMFPSLRVFDTGGSDMCFPYSHPACLGFRFSLDDSVMEADVILILDCDVPWIPSQNPPRKDARIYCVDVDPLNRMMDLSFFPAHGRWKADSHTALKQVLSFSGQKTFEGQAHSSSSKQRRKEEHAARLTSFAELAKPHPDGTFTASHVGAAIRRAVPKDTTFVIEAVTNAVRLHDQLQPENPGSWINCGGTGLGWSGGAALGVKLALDESNRPSFLCAIVGDGAFLFGVPSSVYWIASRYGIPVLTVVLNNKGWNAPRHSLMLVHKDGLALSSSNRDLNISFEPSPDYGGIAKAAAGREFGKFKEGLSAAAARTADELEDALAQAVRMVKKGRGAVVEAVLRDDEVPTTRKMVENELKQEVEAGGR